MEKIDLAILGATPAEIDPLRRLFPLSNALEIAGNHFSINTHRDAVLLMGTTGIGKANAATVSAAVLSRFEVAGVLNVGCSGAYPRSGLAIGDVLISLECICGDEGILRAGDVLPSSRLGIPLVVKNGRSFYDSFPLDGFLTERKIPEILPAGTYTRDGFGVRQFSGPEPGKAGIFHIVYGPSLTVGMVSGDPETAARRSEKYEAMAENMEGSAIAQTCLLFGVPFLEFRGISNMAGVRDKKKWKLTDAVDHCLAAVMNLLENTDF